MLKVKYRADGTFEKDKARLVAKGFLQRLGIDFFACFSPMATMTTVRIIFAVAVVPVHLWPSRERAPGEPRRV